MPRVTEHARERYSEQVMVRLSPSQYARLKEEAKDGSTTESAVIRAALDWWWLSGSKFAGEVIADLTGEIVSRLKKVAGRRRSASA